ncbi:MAG: Uma2 family endonuclease [Pseudomonadota bacterium]
MPVVPHTPPATYADLEALPANLVGEIVFGTLHAQPRPSPVHMRASSRLGSELDGPFDRGRGGPGGWIILLEPELHLGPHVVVPDLAGWRRERMPELPSTAYIQASPDWVCEVLSPSTMRLDRTDKLTVYANAGVGFAWYINPDARTLEVFRLENGRWMIDAALKDAEPVAAAPFQAHNFKLDVLWADTGSGNS